VHGFLSPVRAAWAVVSPSTATGTCSSSIWDARVFQDRDDVRVHGRDERVLVRSFLREPDLNCLKTARSSGAVPPRSASVDAVLNSRFSCVVPVLTFIGHSGIAKDELDQLREARFRENIVRQDDDALISPAQAGCAS
jgi:hypothetical protein